MTSQRVQRPSTPQLFTIAGGIVCGGLGLALALLPLPAAVALILGPPLALLILADPVFALAAAILSVPIQELVALPGGLSVTQACLLLAVASFGLHVLRNPDRPLPFGGLFIPLAIFVWCLGLSTTLTPFSRSEALRETLRWTTVLAIYVIALAALQPNDGRRTTEGERAVERFRPPAWRVLLILGCLLIAPFANALLGLWQFATGSGPESFGIGAGRVRAYGTIGQPNSFAGYLNQAWPLGAALACFALIEVWHGRRRPLILGVLLASAGATAVLVAALVASFSRGGWIGAVAGGAVLGLALLTNLDPRIRRAVPVAVAGGVLALGLVLGLGAGNLLPAPVAQRLASITNNLRLFDVRTVEVTPANFAVVERMAHLQAGWKMLQARPLVGVGPGNFSVTFERAPGIHDEAFTVRPWYESRGHAHNYYLHIAAESGVLGAAAYIGLIGTTIVLAWLAVQRASGWLWKGIAAGGAGVVGAVAGHNVFENLHVLNMGIQLSTIWALLTVAACRPHKREELTV